jgi:hypothetical protein
LRASRSALGAYVQIATVAPGITTFTNSNLLAGTTYSYRVRAYNAGGNSAYSNEATAQTLGDGGGAVVAGTLLSTTSDFSFSGETSDAKVRDPAPSSSATFLSVDRKTQGSWSGVYGAQGRYMMDDSLIPAYAQVGLSGAGGVVWAATSDDPRALLRTSTPDRFAAWTAVLNSRSIWLSDGQPHQVALYLLDWEAAGRVQAINVLDASRGTLLDTQVLSNFEVGHISFGNSRDTSRLKSSGKRDLELH